MVVSKRIMIEVKEEKANIFGDSQIKQLANFFDYSI